MLSRETTAKQGCLINMQQPGGSNSGSDARVLLAPQLNATTITSTVRQLSDCLLVSSPGMKCSLAQRLITASGSPVQHYLGVLHSLSADSQVATCKTPENLHV